MAILLSLWSHIKIANSVTLGTYGALMFTLQSAVKSNGHHFTICTPNQTYYCRHFSSFYLSISFKIAMQQRKRLVLLKSECLIFFRAFFFGHIVSILFLFVSLFLFLPFPLSSLFLFLFYWCAPLCFILSANDLSHLCLIKIGFNAASAPCSGFFSFGLRKIYRHR